MVHFFLARLLLGTCIPYASTFGFPIAPPQHIYSAQRMAKSKSKSKQKVRRQAQSDSTMFWPQQQQQHIYDENDPDNEQEEDEEECLLSQVLDSVVQIHATHSEPDYLIPWQKTHQTTSTSSGFIVQMMTPEGQQSTEEVENDRDFSPRILRVMTNAHSVEYGSMVQVQRRGDERKYEARVEAFCNECDLAILQVESSRFWSGLEPLPISTTLPSLQDEVEVLGYPTGGDSLSITSGVVSRIEMQEYSQSSSHLLAMQVDAAINAGNSGGPVVNEELEVVGVAFQGLEGAENIGYVVPYTVVQHVLQDIARHGTYTGFCSLGISYAMLENKAFRKSLGMVPDQSADDSDSEDERCGVVVKAVSPIAPAKDILQPMDVICKIDGIPIANDGKVPFRPGERVALACYTQTKFLGDTVKLEVWRERQNMELDVPVGILKRLVPAHWNNCSPPYLIVAGLVFTVLSVPYLEASDAWGSFVSDQTSYLLGKWHDSLQRKTDQVVVLAQVLAHRENLGYDKLTDLHLLKINDQEVRSLIHLKELVESSKEDFLRLEFAQPHHNLVVLDRSSVERVTEEVCTEQSIPHSYHLHDSLEEIEVGEDVDGEANGSC